MPEKKTEKRTRTAKPNIFVCVELDSGALAPQNEEGFTDMVSARKALMTTANEVTERDKFVLIRVLETKTAKTQRVLV